MKLTDIIKFNLNCNGEGKPCGGGNWTTASEYTVADVDAFLAESFKGADHREAMTLLGQAIIEPIEQVIPYVEMFSPIFFQPVNYGMLEDNAIPIEDTVAIAFESHPDGAASPVRVGGNKWTRPTFQNWETAIEVPWDSQAVIGWNYLARMLRRATEALARKRDDVARYTLDAAITAVSGHYPAVAGGSMTKASVDAVIKAALQIGFPVTKALINSGTITDMSSWLPSTTLAQYPQARGEEILTNLYISNYAGIEWYANPFAPTAYVYFGGQPNQIGWHQTKGNVKTTSEMEVRNKLDLHLIQDAWHAWYVGNSYTLYRLNIQS